MTDNAEIISVAGAQTWPEKMQCVLCKQDILSEPFGTFSPQGVTRDHIFDAADLIPDEFLDPRTRTQRFLHDSIEDVYVTKPSLDDRKRSLIMSLVRHKTYHTDCLAASPLRAAMEHLYGQTPALGGAEEAAPPASRQYDLQLAVESASCGNVDNGGPGGCRGVLGKTWVVLEWTVGNKKFYETVCQECAYGGKPSGLPRNMKFKRLYGPGIKEEN